MDTVTVKSCEELSLKKQICARLKQIRRDRGFATAKAFALKQDLKVSTYTLHEAGTRSMSFEIIEQYSNLLKIDKHWLLTGEGETQTIKAQAIPIIEWHEISLFPDKLDLMNRLFTASELELPAPSFAVKVKDDSMEPRYPQHTLLLIDTRQTPADREYALFLMEDNTPAFKQYFYQNGIPFIRSLNEDEPAQKLTDKVKVIGKVVQAKIRY